MVTEQENCFRYSTRSVTPTAKPQFTDTRSNLMSCVPIFILSHRMSGAGDGRGTPGLLDGCTASLLRGFLGSACKAEILRLIHAFRAAGPALRSFFVIARRAM